MSYIRYFIPMISEDKGYGYKNRQPAGRALVEGRGHGYKLTIWAQDVKPQTLYGVYLLFADERRYAGVAMGSLPVDERGKGEIRREFDDAALGRFALADITAVAIIARDGHGVSSPLCGYRETPVSWRHGFYEYTAEEPAEELNELKESEESEKSEKSKEPESTAQEEMPTPMPQSEPIDVPMIESEPQMEAPPPVLQDEPPLHLDEPTPAPPEAQEPETHEPEAPEPEVPEPEAPEPEAPEPEAPEPEAPEPEVPEPKVPEPIIETPTEHIPEVEEQAPPLKKAAPEKQDNRDIKWRLPQSEMAKAFRTALDKLHTDTLERQAQCEPEPSIISLFETREHVTPFKKQARDANWISFTPSDPVPPPTNKPNLFGDPFVQAALEEYHHLLLGLTTDSGGPRRYIIGVPGVYSQESMQKAKRLGFSQFKCTRDSFPAWGEAGYWLMFTTVC